MKHCPECNKNYADPTLSFCLADGAPLIFGQALDEANTVLISGDSPSESPTRTIDPQVTVRPDARPDTEPQNVASRWRSKKFWAIAGLTVAIVLGSVFVYRNFGTANAAQIESVAVLPFENGSGDPDLDYLSDGLSETLIDKLSELPQLKVIARNSSFKYRGSGLDLQDVARKLGVRAIVTGRVARVGENVNVRVEMVDVAENRQLWSEQYNRKASDLLAMQQDIAQAASDKLRLKLNGSQEQQLARRETVNPQAYELLLKGRYAFSKPGTDSIKKSIEYYEQAVAADPNYALAYAELSLKYYILTGQSVADPKVYLPKAEAAARRALSLDNDLAEAHLAISRIYMARWQWQVAEAERKRAIELNPNNALAHDLYAQLLAVLGRHDESIVQGRRARELDPLSAFTAANLGFRLYFARRYDESIGELRKALELDPDSDFVYNILGYSYAGKGQFKDAIAAYQSAIRRGDQSTSIQVYLGAAYAMAGDREKALSILKQLQTTKDYVSSGELPALYAALGDKEAAFASLEKAYQEHDLQLQFLKVDPSFDPLRDDPRYPELMRRVGLPS
ncbi:MAG TPA: tetratricopeptide repeat protein [Pyrinomonadaceae bacterium]|nr:tetratricopeptide repeat protein [Pyrinomonadaceae bacterium]